MRFSRSLLVSVALVSTGSPAVSSAQSNGAAATPETTGLDDIVVTARRREEALQDVPVAITALSGDALEQRGVRAAEDLRMAVPGLNISGQRRDEASYYLRGQGPGIFNTGQRNFTSVATYFAEVPTEVAGPGIFFDLASVQVLKGPQGTLFGRNTTGGAVLLEPARPTSALEGYVKGTLGNYDLREFEGVLNIPVVPDILSIRLAGNIAKRDGFTTSVPTGQKLDGRNYRAYRASILLTPMEGFENLTVIDGRNKDQSGTSAVLRQINPSAAIGPVLQSFLNQQRALGVRKTLIPELLYEQQDTFGVTNRTSWNVSDAVTLKNIISFRKIRTDRASDYDGTPVPTFLIENARSPRKWQTGQEQFTEEFQVQGRIPQVNLSYILGFYHESSKPGFPQEIRQSLFGTLSVRNLDNHDESNALFTHVEFDLTDDLQLSGGFRYTWDKRRAGISVFDAAGNCTQRIPPGVGAITCPFTARARFDAPTYDATVRYQLSPRSQIYAAYRHGYKSGGVNLPSPAPEFTTFDPEYVDEFEVGLKADWDIGVPLRTNIAVFIDKYKDIQISSPVVIPNVGIISLVQNAASATNKGVEFETTIAPVRDLSLTGFISYLDAHSDVTIPGTAAIKGRQTAFQPKWKYGVNGRYHIPVPATFGELTVSADYSWQSRTNTNEVDNRFITTYPSYGLLNARIEFDNIADRGIDLTLFANNLTNKKYILGGFPLASALGFESALYGEPRMYGASLKLHFGR